MQLGSRLRKIGEIQWLEGRGDSTQNFDGLISWNCPFGRPKRHWRNKMTD